MAGLTLRSLLSPRSGNLPVITAMLEAGGSRHCRSFGQAFLLSLRGFRPQRQSCAVYRSTVEDGTLGFVTGPWRGCASAGLADPHLAANESESRALAAEVLHLYREVHLIEQLSEQLAALLNISAVGQSALAQAQRLISATHGSILILDKAEGSLRSAASFGPDSLSNRGPSPGRLSPDSRFAASILERGIAEIVNNCDSSRLSMRSATSGL